MKICHILKAINFHTKFIAFRDSKRALPHKETKHVCHICNGFPPAVGGTETHNYSLVKYLLKKGYDVDVIVLRPKKLSTKAIIEAENGVNKGIKVHNIFPMKFPFWIFQIKKATKEIEKGGKIDVFDIHSMKHIPPFMFLGNKNIIFSLHFFEILCADAKKWPRPCLASFKKCRKCISLLSYLKWRFLRYLVKNKVKKYMVKYNSLKDAMIQSGIEEDKIEVIPHWIDNDMIINNNLFSKKKSKKHFDFYFFGRLSEEKGVKILLKAFSLLSRSKKNCRLFFIGDGVLRDSLEEYVKQYNLEDKVFFLGFIEHKKLFNELLKADAIVFPNLYFNYEWALIEAMFTKIPILAADVFAADEILKNNQNALLFNPNPESLLEKMRLIAEDKDISDKIAENAFNTVNKKHNMKNLGKYDELVEKLLNSNN